MIKELIFSGKKYFEGKFLCYIGMNIKAPKSSLPAYYMADSPVDGADKLLKAQQDTINNKVNVQGKQC